MEPPIYQIENNQQYHAKLGFQRSGPVTASLSTKPCAVPSSAGDPQDSEVLQTENGHHARWIYSGCSYNVLKHKKVNILITLLIDYHIIFSGIV